MGARTIAWGRCTPLTIVDQFGIKISGFTLSFEALGHLLKKKKKKKEERGRSVAIRMRGGSAQLFNVEDNSRRI